MKTTNRLLLFLLLFTASLSAQEQDYPFRNPDLEVEMRINDLLSRLTLQEKVQLMKHQAPAIPRLGIPAYDWWNEALHGVARTQERVTVYPQAIGMAATFDKEALRKMADYTSTEGRALFNEDLREGKTGERYRGLTYWTPNINIFRDPRWGRGQETYGEDPYLTGQMGSAFVKGLEGDHPYYLKAVACAKHFAVHSGPEYNRHSYDARVSAFDLWDTYLPAFRELIVKAKVHGVMCAYNRVDGEPCCGNNELLHDILRNQWQFNGYVTSDCGGVSDFTAHHKTHRDDMEAVADAVLTGTDLECGDLYHLLEQSVNRGLISERDINVSLKRLLTILFKIGMFDPADRVPYSSIGREVIECDAHKQHAYEMARKSIVLLENKKNILPLDSRKIKRIALVGPNADNEKAQLANYFGVPSEIITPLKSLQNRFGDRITIDYMKGVDIVDKEKEGLSFAQIAARARKCDLILFVGGITADYEGEAGDAGAAGYGAFVSGDRTTTQLPAVQIELLKELKKTGRPLVVVNMSGSVMNFEWESKQADALLQAWYGGQAAGDAITDVLFGEYNPAGRMPLTTYLSDSDLPAFEDYSMANRTYRYFTGEVRYPFGYGLSYTRFAYEGMSCPETVETGKHIELSCTVTNSGARDGDEVVQLYVVHPRQPNHRVPLCTLKGFERITLKKGESRRVTFTLTPEELALTDSNGNLIESEGNVTLYIGGGQPGKSQGMSASLTVTGEPYMLF